MVIEATDYQQFLETKRVTAPTCGFEVSPDTLNPMLFEWQRCAVAWALKRGRAALWEDCGLGKSPQQLEVANRVCVRTEGEALIVAPLAVAQQTAMEGEKFGIPITICRSKLDLRPGINITNYEMVSAFDPSVFASITLDESSILKGNGPMRKELTSFAETIPYRLCCTATPAPNDVEELINHAEFLGIMRGSEILAIYFAQDGNTTHKWKLKEHAAGAFWKWLASWALALRKPSDIGGDDTGFNLPPIHYHQHTVEAPLPQDALLQAEARGIREQRQVRKATLVDRVKTAAELANGSDQPWVIWCDLNEESKQLTKAIAGAVEVTGTMKLDEKIERLNGFSEGKYRVIVTKPEIAGHGLNWQHCANAAFVGLGNSYERYYQAVRRNWRFGQHREVNVHVITSEADGPIIRNIERKEKQSSEMMEQLVRETRELTGVEGSGREDMDYQESVRVGENWACYLGDCVEGIRKLETESVGLSVFSPPFPTMYAYTNSPRDIGNCRDIEEMMAHFRHLIPELFRVTKPGRSCAIHLTQGLSFLNRDGFVGIKDFRGAVIESMQDQGWIYYGECTIDKDPQLKAIRTKDRGLLFKTLATDSSHSRMALADYLVQFKKPGENAEPIRAGISEKYVNSTGWITQEEWIRWARPVWYGADWAPDGDGIRETDVLQNYRDGRADDDEKHLCPLQLGVIERCIKLWSNPGDLILSPFTGIGSEGFQALKFKRQFVGFELKRSYWELACKNLARAEMDGKQKTLFDGMFEGER